MGSVCALYSTTKCVILVLTIRNENLRQRTYYYVKLGTNENNAAAENFTRNA